MRDKVDIGNVWRGCPQALVLGSLVVCLATPIAVAEEDLGVTMRMVTDDDLTGAVTREIVLPEPVPSDRGGQGSTNGAGGNRNTDNPFMEEDRPGQGRNRPEFSPPGLRDKASDKAREHRSDAHRSGPPERPGNSGRPDHAGRPDRPGNSNRP